METAKVAPPMRGPIRQRGSAQEGQTWLRDFFGEGFFCELRLYGVLRSSLCVLTEGAQRRGMWHHAYAGKGVLQEDESQEPRRRTAPCWHAW
jgi:hypothetical protein